MRPMFDSKRFFEESWPKISQGFESEAAAETEIEWILGHARPPRLYWGRGREKQPLRGR